MSETKKFELSSPIAILIAGVIIAGAVVYTNRNPVLAENRVPTPSVNANVPAPKADEHIVGSPNAPIVLIEYSDFECPYCSLVYPTLKQIVAQSNGQVAWVMRHFPLTSIHPEANPAANAAECVAEQLGNEGWWKFTDALFANQQKLGSAYYEEVAVQLGADRAKYKSCFASSKYQAKIDAETNEAMQNGGQGTPYTIVYGYGQQKGVSGAQPLANFKAVIEAVKARQ